MQRQTLAFIFVALTIAFITVGDRILPGSLGQASRNTRVGISRFLMGLVPNKAPNLNEEREKELEDLGN